MEQLLSGYVIYSLSFLLIYIALATILHLQFSITGIVNFGIVGFWGFGMYVFALLQMKLAMPFVPAIILACALTGVISMILGRIILNLGDQEVLVGTLAFATIIEYLTTTEKWATNGVMGLGTIRMPFDFGLATNAVYFLFILLCLILLILYTAKLKKSPYGRLLLSIKDNEVLSQSLGKPTFRHKIIFFTFTCMLIGFFGALSAPLYNYIFPRMIGPGITFTIWIALMLGGRTRLLGGMVGVVATVGLFDYFIETVVPIPTEYAEMVPNFKFALYGLMLILILMFRPLGILGDRKKEGAR
ncbi:MAG TPA: branched-chain amino acid ABC transporter permease [Anaerovoracaceae bacterium]|nr:branched-chain amino acid ABC transporter permease [Anaerovoracaceae bacterium]